MEYEILKTVNSKLVYQHWPKKLQMLFYLQYNHVHNEYELFRSLPQHIILGNYCSV